MTTLETIVITRVVDRGTQDRNGDCMHVKEEASSRLFLAREACVVIGQRLSFCHNICLVAISIRAGF